jgi:drug/metabolite transporter (DMT)-like permease
MCLLWSGFTFCLLVMYITAAVFLGEHDATVFNLALLSADAWSMLFGVFVFGRVLNLWYFVAYGLIVVGVVFYHRRRPESVLLNDTLKEEGTPLLASSSDSELDS